MQDKIKADKAEFEKRIKTDQETAQAVLDLEKEYIDMIMKENSAAQDWYKKFPEIIFNPFQEEQAVGTFQYPCQKILQYKTLHGKQLLHGLLNCLKQNMIPPIKDTYINMGNCYPFLGFTNNVLLSVHANQKGYRDMHWCSSGFIKEKGYKIKANEQPTYLCYWSFSLDKSPLSFSEAFQKIYHNAASKIFLKGHCYAVYNAEQIIGISSLQEDVPSSFSIDEKIKKCECIIGGMGVSVAYKNNVNYDMKKDSIMLPENSFSLEKYCAMLIHQACYATAHPERLNRKLVQWEEDLCCMLAAISISEQLQLSEYLDFNAKRTKNWMRKLSKNPESLFIILGEAQRIVNYMMELCPEDTGKALSEYDFTQPLQSRINKAKKGKQGDVS